MSIYNAIRKKATEMKISVSPSDVTRIAGTIRFACSDIRTANLSPVIERELLRLLTQAKEELPLIRNQETVSPTATQAETFSLIDTSLKNKVCPRCGRSMRDVSLADYTKAIYCGGDCRITLWPSNETDKTK